MKKSVCVIIVTYNRKKLLLELLKKLSVLTYPISGIVIVDNNSEDGTADELVKEKIIYSCRACKVVNSKWSGIDIFYYLSPINTGGSGGFSKAFEIVKELPYDCVWAMDDDVEPDSDCLEIMMSYLDQNARMVIPCRGDDMHKDYAILELNMRNPLLFRGIKRKSRRVNGATIKEPFVYVEDMPFEGPLMEMSLIREIGIPNKDYFILYDDSDYARRALKVTKIRYIRDAKLHKKIIPQKSKGGWTWKHYYDMRNFVYFDRTYGDNWAVRKIRPLLRIVYTLIRAILKGEFHTIKWFVRAYCDGIAGRMGKTYDILQLNNS